VNIQAKFALFLDCGSVFSYSVPIGTWSLEKREGIVKLHVQSGQAFQLISLQQSQRFVKLPQTFVHQMKYTHKSYLMYQQHSFNFVCGSTFICSSE
jgi:regulatory protein YycI of two-component signal transduction system YycFG